MSSARNKGLSPSRGVVLQGSEGAAMGEEEGREGGEHADKHASR